MPAFKSAHTYRRFRREVTTSTRYVRGGEADDFLQTLLREARARIDVVPAGSILWRAQLGHDWEALREGQQHVADVPCPFPPERMKPLRDRAREGRANPKGIPYLYVSTHRETALAEVRPWLRSLVSVAQFKTLRELKLVNCTEDGKRTRVFIGGTPPEHWDTAVWLDIDEAFSRPVTLSDELADYVPTQIIAELFKVHGFDGVVYRSALGSGLVHLYRKCLVEIARNFNIASGVVGQLRVHHPPNA